MAMSAKGVFYIAFYFRIKTKSLKKTVEKYIKKNLIVTFYFHLSQKPLHLIFHWEREKEWERVGDKYDVGTNNYLYTKIK